MVVVFGGICPACQTDEGGIGPGGGLNSADGHVAGLSRAEYLGVK